MSSLQEVQQKVDEVKIQMGENMEKLMARGEQLDNLEQKSAELEKNSKAFAKGAKGMKHKMCWNHYKFFFISLFVLIVIIVIILAAAGVFR